jgi:hypothetical protein
MRIRTTFTDYKSILSHRRSLSAIVQALQNAQQITKFHVACIGEKRNAYKVLLGSPEGKRPVGRPRRR